MLVEIQCPDGSNLEILLEPTDRNIRHLKQHIQAKQGTPIPHQTLYSLEGELKNGSPIPKDVPLSLVCVDYKVIPDQETLRHITMVWLTDNPETRETILLYPNILEQLPIPNGNKDDIVSTYGPIQHWALHPSITDLSHLFSHRPIFVRDRMGVNQSIVTKMVTLWDFNEDISGWDTSHVTRMESTLAYCPSFNQPIGGWDVSQVTNFRCLFVGCRQFNQSLRDWDLSNAQETTAMFKECHLFQDDLSSWKLPKLENATNMFDGAYKFQADPTNLLQQWTAHNILPKRLRIHEGGIVTVRCL